MFCLLSNICSVSIFNGKKWPWSFFPGWKLPVVNRIFRPSKSGTAVFALLSYLRLGSLLRLKMYEASDNNLKKKSCNSNTKTSSKASLASSLPHDGMWLSKPWATTKRYLLVSSGFLSGKSQHHWDAPSSMWGSSPKRWFPKPLHSRSRCCSQAWDPTGLTNIRCSHFFRNW